MANNNTFFNGPVLTYSASSDKFRQGINLVNIGDFSNNNSLKIRNDGGFIRTLNGVVQRQNYFNEDFAAEHFGNVSGSLATMDTQGQLGEVVDHVIERRDLGQAQVRDYGSSPFTDPDQLYDNPQVVLQKYTFNELTQDVLDVGPDVQRTRLRSSYYDLNENFFDKSGNRYEAAANLRLWSRMYPDDPKDLGPYDLDVFYDGTATTSPEVTIGSKNYRAKITSDALNANAGVTAASANGLLDFNSAPDGGPATRAQDLAFSVSMWVNFSDLSTVSYFFAKENTVVHVPLSNFTYEAYLTPGTPQVTFALKSAGVTNLWLFRSVNASVVSVGEWNHFAFTYAGGAASTPIIYINGQLPATTGLNNTGYTGMTPEYDQRLFIAGNGASANEIDGQIAEVGIWQKNLSATEVTTLYNATREGVQRTKTLTSFAHDGIIEPLEIRRVLDRTLPGYPTVAHSVKSNVSISDEERRESTLKTDFVDLRDSATRPFLDQQGQIGDVDIPAQFSDADSNLAPYTDTDQLELFYPADVLDAEMRSTLIDGFVSGSVTYTAARTNSLNPNFVVARHGFVFSQNDNYGYDSIAFGGLKK